MCKGQDNNLFRNISIYQMARRQYPDYFNPYPANVENKVSS